MEQSWSNCGLEFNVWSTFTVNIPQGVFGRDIPVYNVCLSKYLWFMLLTLLHNKKTTQATTNLNNSENIFLQFIKTHNNI